MRHLFSTDTETFLIRPGVQAPPVVCAQACVDTGEAFLTHANPLLAPTKADYSRSLIEAVLRDPGYLINGHRVAHDMACIASSWPELLPLIFAAYDADRIVCTIVRAKLGDIASGRFTPDRTYPLNEVVARLTDGRVILDKTDPWRLRYGELWNVPLNQWPAEAKHYALGDASAQKVVYLEQETQIPKEHLVDQYRQSRRDFMLYLQSCWGIRTNPRQVERYYAQTLVEATKDREIAERAGLVRGPRPKGVKGSWKEGSRNLKAAMARMVQVCQALGEEIPLTETGQERRKELKKALGREVTALEIYESSGGEYVSLDEDACLASGDEALEAMQRYGSLSTTLTRVARLRHGYTLPIQARFNSLMETGRTSCSQGDVEEGVSPPAWGSQVQNPPRKEGVRECFVAREDDPRYAGLPGQYIEPR